MKLFGRRVGWLGWVLAGALAVSAGGVALAQTRTTPTTTQAGTADKAGRRADGFGWRRGLVRRVLHGEVTIQAKGGRRTVVLARGKVTALAANSITITSDDNVATSFRIDDATRFGFLREPDPRAELKVGDTALVVGEKSGDANLAKRVVSAKDLPKAGATP
jgi:hypothetical protein